MFVVLMPFVAMVSSFHQFHLKEAESWQPKRRVSDITFVEADFPWPRELVANLFLVPAF